MLLSPTRQVSYYVSESFAMYYLCGYIFMCTWMYNSLSVAVYACAPGLGLRSSSSLSRFYRTLFAVSCLSYLISLSVAEVFSMFYTVFDFYMFPPSHSSPFTINFMKD